MVSLHAIINTRGIGKEKSDNWKGLGTHLLSLSPSILGGGEGGLLQ